MSHDHCTRPNQADTTAQHERRHALPVRHHVNTEQARHTRAAAEVSLPRLYALRLGYLIIAVGLALVKWPLIDQPPQPWPLFEGVETCMLVALSLLWFLGVRYPLQLLPALLFELAWKLIWTIVVVLPLWRSDQLDPATLYVFYTCLAGRDPGSPSSRGATCSPTT